MKKIILAIVTLFLLGIAHAQGFINLNKTGSKNYLAKFSAKEKLQTATAETDSTLTFLIRDSAKQNLDLLLHFDALGKCYKETRVLSCDSCYQKMVNNTLSNKTYQWKKVDDKTYVSKYSKGLVLTLLAEGTFSFVIQRSELGRKEYRRQFGKQ
ncbi:MAG: hypothetical protein ABS85_09695 [Sphingobacteriales bacterium SCN 48-20]|uniref:hypothetical protein n=1 Tax=Terrimonas ferruginea TaxID=249 RepID=UPI0008685A15|nr:hypothetical protein [Terrimonas ferruginea]MBN8782035.1 hypothetical protein [Terrimonas ferruginea]ODT92376.1 MAG: hypothetical protein ABS85_09695 [Sphingobacteriales bacterium SCN 48-20]OJW45166.1 MAG: hypothetical protein BGO56_17180 [Sphingobacteriales bacterium 48-107]